MGKIQCNKECWNCGNVIDNDNICPKCGEHIDNDPFTEALHMKTLILDYSKWRCGGSGSNHLGEGGVYLLNRQGYMCCLGQFSKQINPTITDGYILNKGYPSSTHIKIEGLNRLTVEYGMTVHANTSLSDDAAALNDDIFTTPEEKIRKLSKLFAKHGYKIQVINKP